MKRAWATFLIATALVVLIRPAHAFIEAPSPFAVDSTLQQQDSVAPPPPVMRVKAVSRGFGTIYYDGGGTGFVTDVDGSLFLDVVPDGNNSTKDDVGYRFHFIDGELPKALQSLPSGAWAPLGPPNRHYIPIHWHESGTWWHDAFSFRMYVTAVDRAGNESLPSNALVISDDGNMETMFDKQPGPVPSVADIQGNWTGKGDDGTKVHLSIAGRLFRLASGREAYVGFLQVWRKEDGQQQLVVDAGADLKLAGPYKLQDNRLQFSLSVPGTFKYYDLRRDAR